MEMDRHRQIAENRAKALEKIRLRQQNIKNKGSGTIPTPSTVNEEASTSTNVSTSTNQNGAPEQKRKLVLTPEQQAMIERNRRKALERKNLQNGVTDGNLRDATKGINANSLDSIRITAAPSESQGGKNTERIRPSVRKSDYIEYDFSTMTDTFGGFLADDNSNDLNNKGPGEKSLEQWKDEQQQRKVLVDPAPPTDIRNAPKCFECKSVEIDQELFKIFGCRVCKKCKEKFPEKYSLLTKTECREDYFLTESELQDEELFKRIVKNNPHNGTYSKMQLYLRYQIEEFAFKKWGSEELLDNEWLRREEMRIKRRDKKFNNRLKDMRKKLRAEEWTRKLKGDRGERHVHQWSQPVGINDPEQPGLVKRRCKECGMETEEILM